MGTEQAGCEGERKNGPEARGLVYDIEMISDVSGLLQAFEFYRVLCKHLFVLMFVSEI